jgi:MFS family permease
MSRPQAFWTLSAVLALLLFAASAPSPVYVLYQAAWQLSPTTLTSVFAIYAMALLVALIFAGSLSDHAGRRPVVLTALVVEVAAMTLFALAGDVRVLFLARILQGLATGVATGALSAWLLDLRSPADARLGALVGSTAPSIGLAVGALGSGLLVQYAPAPTHLVFWLLAGVFAVGALAVLVVPETITAEPHWSTALRPHAGVPREVRGLFATIAPSMAAFWALSGLYLSLGPSLAGSLLHAGNRLTGGLVITALTGAGALASVLTRTWPARRAMINGSLALVVGVICSVLALHAGSVALFFAGSIIAGLGFGPAFSGAFRALTAQAPNSERAAVVASIYVISYLAFSLPTVAAGFGATELGLLRTTDIYGLTIVILATAATIAFALHRARPAAGPHHEATPCPGTVAPCPDPIRATPELASS